jgi:ribosome-associated toxin RatA of RatAB toxin-antitoxin module
MRPEPTMLLDRRRTTVTDAVRERIVVRADPDTILDVVADFEAYPQWQPEVKDVEILETDDDGWGTRVRFVIDARLFTTSLVLAYTYSEAAMRWHLVEGDPVKRNDGEYVLRDLGDGTTEVTYALEIDPGVPVPGIVRRQAAKRIVDSGLHGLKRRVEAVR